MAVMDEFKEERARIKSASPKEKWQYFLDYYKWYVIAGLAAVFVISTFIYQAVTKKDIVFNACIFNGSQIDFLGDQPAIIDEFSEYCGINPQKEQVLFDTSIQIGLGTGDDMNAAQKMMVYIASAEIDVMVSDSESIKRYAYQKSFFDLRDFLTPQQLEKYQDSFYYIDKAVADEIDKGSYSIDFDFETLYKDPLDTASMEDPVPVGIYLPADSPLLQYYLFLDDRPVVSILVNTTRPETAKQFLEFFLP